MRRLPAIDMHAHIKPDIASRELDGLNAVVFAATRSLAEAEQVRSRTDAQTIWGVGCHPGLVKVQKAFDQVQFDRLVADTPLVSEVGIDGSSRVPLDLQRATFTAILHRLQLQPRIVSVHSYDACDAVLDAIEGAKAKGIVLHWWLGDERQTQRAIKLGCYFSINDAMIRKGVSLVALPFERLLTETDHPFGDKRGAQPRQPGGVVSVEKAIANANGMADAIEARRHVWHSFLRLIGEVGCEELMPRNVRTFLIAL